ncbi:unnamed protein product [Nippostrongylus brasiliensis]|uniref:LITAF domain-containing protein n=1 Tax=Nippostrongylus brasiliensis TaxID=27835 RepID=A0A0N4XX57_NIPBR|nr:unnamed protein product [Nippostrongylus brasiliensis]
MLVWTTVAAVMLLVSASDRSSEEKKPKPTKQTKPPKTTPTRETRPPPSTATAAPINVTRGYIPTNSSGIPSNSTGNVTVVPPFNTTGLPVVNITGSPMITPSNVTLSRPGNSTVLPPISSSIPPNPSNEDVPFLVNVVGCAFALDIPLDTLLLFSICAVTDNQVELTCAACRNSLTSNGIIANVATNFIDCLGGYCI